MIIVAQCRHARHLASDMKDKKYGPIIKSDIGNKI